jgi:beta-1,4-mannosyltransferase
MAAKIIVFPRGDNPYQHLLSHAILGAHPDVQFAFLRASIGVVVCFPLVSLWMRLRGYKLIHVHWPNFGLSYDSSVPRAKLLSLYVSLYNIWCLKVLGFRIVWTVHNVLPHEHLTSNDRLVASYLSRSARAKIVHSQRTIAQMRGLGLNVANCTVIPHGNYIGAYPDRMSRVDARRELRLVNEFVVLFFGAVRPYKGVDELLDVWEEVHGHERLLMIAGEVAQPATRRRIVDAQYFGVRLCDGYQSNFDVERLFKACDVVCLPFRRITTSGSALLALSFGKPIIAPREGALMDFPRDVGYLYDRTSAGALKESLLRAMSNRDEVEECGRHAKEYARTLSWKKIGEDTYGVYETVLNERALIRGV